MPDVAPAFLVVLVGSGLAVVQAWRFTSREATLLLASFTAHIISAFAYIAVTRAVGGDLYAYAADGEVLAAAMRADFTLFGPEVLKLLLHQSALLPVEIVGAGSPTGTMSALAGFLTLMTGGSAHTLCLTIATAAYFGQVAVYRAVCSNFPERYHRRLLVAILLVPSTVYWCSALVKEAVVMIGLGPLLLGADRLIRRGDLGGVVGILAGSFVIALVKPYVLVAAVFAGATWVYVEIRRRRRAVGVPATHLLLAALGTLAGSALLFRLFPSYGPESLAEQAAYYQDLGQSYVGGSSYAIGDASRGTIAGQLEFAPLAIVTALFRPVVFEARSPQVLINGLETAVALALFLPLLAPRRIRGAWAASNSLPFLAFCVVFAFVLALGVGLTTTNLGTLSRYRMPLVPFLWTWLLVANAPAIASVPRAAVTNRPLAASRRRDPSGATWQGKSPAADGPAERRG